VAMFSITMRMIMSNPSAKTSTLRLPRL